jgi:hypothetical protein
MRSVWFVTDVTNKPSAEYQPAAAVGQSELS